MSIFDLSSRAVVSWSSGASLLAGGLVYLGRADLTMSGTVGGAGDRCAKLAANSVTLSGNISLSEADAAFTAVSMKRYASNLYLSE